MVKTAKVGKSRQTFTDEQKATALALVVDYRHDFAGAAKAARVPEKLLHAWAIGSGVPREVFLQFVEKRMAVLQELRETLPPPFGVTKSAK